MREREGEQKNRKVVTSLNALAGDMSGRYTEGDDDDGGGGTSNVWRNEWSKKSGEEKEQCTEQTREE